MKWSKFMAVASLSLLACAMAGSADAGQVRVRERGMYQSGARGGARRLLAVSGSGFDADAAAKSAVVALGDRLGVVASLGDLRVRRADSDAAGRRHVRLQQLFGGVEVDGRELIVHFDANGGVYEINGNWLDLSAHAPFPPPAVVVNGATLVVYCRDDDATSAKLAWRLRKGLKIVFTDAQTGETLHVRRAAPGSVEDDVDDDDDNLELDPDELIRFAADTPFPDGNEITINGNLPETQGGKAVEVPAVQDGDGNIYFTGKSSNGVEVGVLDGIAAPQFRAEAKAIGEGETKTDWTDEFLSRTGWTVYSDSLDADMPNAFGIMNNVLAAVEYYKAAFNRDSYDGKGGRVAAWRFWQITSADIDSGFGNAFWTSLGESLAQTNGCFFFGYHLDSNKSETSLDTCAHELTHGITSWSADLQYEGESGALNESFSDIIAAACEFAVHPLAADPLNPGPGEADWLFDEDSGEAARSYASPMEYDQPSRYKGHKWVNTGDTSEKNDNGGVHSNSGVQNHFFYLLCEGGSGVNDGIKYEVAGIGVEKAVQIAYQALTAYCGKLTDYESVIGCWESAAWDLVDDGVIESNDVESVAQAWAAVKTPRKTVDGASWTVTLNVNGGVLVGVDAKFPVARGKPVGAPPVPEREGYAFKGWFTKKSGGSKVSAKTKVTKDVTYYARWKVRKYKVSAVPSATAAGKVSGAGTKTYGSKVTLKATAKKGYVFVKWENLDDPETPWPSVLKYRQPNVSFKVPSRAVRVRAVFAKVSADQGLDLSVEDADDWYLETEPARIIRISADSLSYPKVTVAGLPGGIIFSPTDESDARHVILPFGPPVKPGVYTAKITAKNRAGKSAAKSVRIVAPNSSAAITDGLIAGLVTSTLSPYVVDGGVKMNCTLADLGVEVFATNGWKLASVTGLPTGLSWNGSAIVGAASATGLYTVTFTMKKTVGTGKKAKTYTSTATATFAVNALLPGEVVGTYNGFANTDVADPGDGGGEVGEGGDDEEYAIYTPVVDGWASAAKITVTAAGKITANIGGESVTGSGFDSVSNGVYAVTLKKTQKIKTGYLKGKTKVWEAYLEIDTRTAWCGRQVSGWYSTYTTGLCGMASAWISAQRNAFGGNAEAQAVAAEVAGTLKFTPKAVGGRDWSYELNPGGSAVAVTAKANGTAVLAGTIAKTKVSGTAMFEVSEPAEKAVLNEQRSAKPGVPILGCADECEDPVPVVVQTATARFFTTKFVVEVVYTLENGEVVEASGKVWKK